MNWVCALGFCLVFVSCSPVSVPDQEPRFSITFCDVGQGDAALVRFSDSTTLLIDAGSYGSGIDTILTNRNIHVINDLAVTHAHEDHYGNAGLVCRQFTVERVWLSARGTWPGDKAYAAFVRLVADTLGIDTIVMFRGRQAPGGVSQRVTCLWPDTAAVITESDTCNALSLVLSISNGTCTALMAADINFESEKRLLDCPGELSATILKAPHHGSKTSSSTAFLAAVAPDAAVVSVGSGNPFGHPSDEAIARLAQTNAVVLRTDRNGSITIYGKKGGGLLFDFDK
ncbi:MAG: hypothetical protein A2268_16145 [Candidatus Raymondbacteria bacterium RifOxyA12_full_50_37]|uniref:Metallo-beta-lactamase domain-containing protein n=1 Tax=Candidatus Raymondbacteria bacterium RIFOXYD12_FULL_49_13 TaxID=1817890 RepID=A0A1F7FBR6_UNCRA|nr:MAG: hypothetical protein A2268_16145 [Candidatus Raymondbacteria bacterium RifOxyA12_full_50_37]OGJ87490.1 MAG: hypothetical protein A2350_13830 [Candidatus Raymondbacteria bacterium RifOxyB12_full_50_8]OGJ94328.1 MAG: hypothetical protein A2248_14340 [Candidatus Raymondbacteria bacterium RIFOXYA2_FULL_49_16]OGJ95270.1 MAG: hypothetical protein A2453_05765 [Candidatus Raymondbacteria bacterium RIFOXYC2_FULL_50_21]OGK04109.1 MAG: hypothetical protein A2519_19610 [Candidatus Raymondbacteria b